MSGITFLKQNPSKLGWDSPIRKMVCGLSFLLWLALLQTTLAVNVPAPNGTVVTQILSATSSNPEVKVVEDRDLGKILVYPPQPKEFTVKIIARIMYPDDQYLEKISTVMVGGAGVTIESSEIRNSLILATLKVAPGASGGRFSITYENEDNPNHKGCNVRLLPVEIDAFIYGESSRKIDDCIQRTESSDENDDVRVITGGHVKFVADIANADNLNLSYEWSFSGGVADSDNTKKEINWNAPTTDAEITLTLKIKSGSGNEVGSFEVKILPVKPRIVRVKFVDDGTGKIVQLKDSDKNAVITAPQYDRIDESDWESAGGHEARQGDHKNDLMEVFKNESVAYVKGGKMKLQADLAATDFKDQIMSKPHTPAQHKDLSAKTSLKMSVIDSSPSLTFNPNYALEIAESSEIVEVSPLASF